MTKTFKGKIQGTWQEQDSGKFRARFLPDGDTEAIDIPIDGDEFYKIKFDRHAILTLDYNL